MGTCTSKRVFIINEELSGQGAEVLKIAEKLHISRREVDLLYQQFCSIDVDLSGIVDVSEFIIHHHISSEIFGELVFSLFDRDKSGKLDFKEYLIAVWNYCTLDKDSLARFAFEIFDVDDSGVLSAEDLQEIIDIVWGYKNNDRVAKALKRLDETNTGSIRKEEFVDMAKHFPILLFPVFEVQDKLRGTGLVRYMWTKMTEQRNFRFGKKTVFEILDYDTRYIDKNFEYVLTHIPAVNQEKARRLSVRIQQKSLRRLTRTAIKKADVRKHANDGIHKNGGGGKKKLSLQDRSLHKASLSNDPPSSSTNSSSYHYEQDEPSEMIQIKLNSPKKAKTPKKIPDMHLNLGVLGSNQHDSRQNTPQKGEIILSTDKIISPRLVQSPYNATNNYTSSARKQRDELGALPNVTYLTRDGGGDSTQRSTTSSQNTQRTGRIVASLNSPRSGGGSSGVGSNNNSSSSSAAPKRSARNSPRNEYYSTSSAPSTLLSNSTADTRIQYGGGGGGGGATSNSSTSIEIPSLQVTPHYQGKDNPYMNTPNKSTNNGIKRQPPPPLDPTIYETSRGTAQKYVRSGGSSPVTQREDIKESGRNTQSSKRITSGQVSGRTSGETSSHLTPKDSNRPSDNSDRWTPGRGRSSSHSSPLMTNTSNTSLLLSSPLLTPLNKTNQPMTPSYTHPHTTPTSTSAAAHMSTMNSTPLAGVGGVGGGYNSKGPTPRNFPSPISISAR